MALVGQIYWDSLFSDVGRMSIVKIAVLLMQPMLYAIRTLGFPFSQVYNP
ncbi:hypothetical protein BEL031_1319 [Escherichia coli]|nr:hypothetical protein BEL031_1319 [Escherichia coli]